MQTKVAERFLIGILLVVAGGIVLHAPLSVWLSTQVPEQALVVKAWKELLLGLALVLLVVEVWRRKLLGDFLHDRLMQIALAYALLHFTMAVLFADKNGWTAVGAGLLIDLRYVLYLVLVYGAMRLYPHWRDVFIKIFVAGAAVVVGFGLLQMFVLPKDILTHIGYSKDTILPYMTVDENPEYIRINSTLRGPNPLGAYTAIVIGVLTAVMMKWKLSRRSWLLAGGAMLVALLVLGASHSRSSVIGAIIASVIVVVVAVSAKMRKRLLVGVGIGALVLVGAIFALREDPVVSNLVFHDSPTTGAKIDSNSAHVESLAEGVSRMVRQPLGAGVGSTGSASLLSDQSLILENHYLFIAHEAGWIGLVLFSWLFVEIMKQLWRRRQHVLALGVFGSGVGLAVIGLLLPVWADDTVSIVWWGLAGLGIGLPVDGWKTGSRDRRREKKHG